MTLRDKVLLYAKYTVNFHSSELADIEMLNTVFGTDITLKEVTEQPPQAAEKK